MGIGPTAGGGRCLVGRYLWLNDESWLTKSAGAGFAGKSTLRSTFQPLMRPGWTRPGATWQNTSTAAPRAGHDGRGGSPVALLRAMVESRRRCSPRQGLRIEGAHSIANDTDGGATARRLTGVRGHRRAVDRRRGGRVFRDASLSKSPRSSQGSWSIRWSKGKHLWCFSDRRPGAQFR